MIGKLGMMKRHSRARWAKMTNTARWWALCHKRYSSAWGGFGTTRWSLRNWHNRDGGTQPTTSLNVIRSMAHLKWGFQRSLHCKQITMQMHLLPQHLESLRSQLILSPEYCKDRHGLLDQEVVIWGWVLASRSRTHVYLDLCLPQSPIHHICQKRSPLSLYAVTPA